MCVSNGCIMNYRQTITSTILPVFLLCFVGVSCSCNEQDETNISGLVPESEMVHVVFSLQWILENDTDPNPRFVYITFPADWLEDSPYVSKGEPTVELNVPRRLMELDDMNDDPEWITVTFPNDFFSGLPEYKPENTISPPQLFSEPTSFHFFTGPGENPPDEIIYLYSRFGAVNWTLSVEAPWLTLSRSHGTARGLAEQPRTEVTLSIDATGLKKGTYTNTLILTTEQISYRREILVNFYVTDAQPGQSPDIDIMLAPDSELAEGSELTDEISLDQALVRYEILGSPESRDWPKMYDFNTGDFCLLVTGRVKNNTKQDILVNLRATGYDKDGNEVSWSLQVDSSHSGMGITTFDLTKDSSADFTLYMGWSEDTELIRLFTSSSEKTDITQP